MQDFRRQAVWHRAHAFNLEVQRVIEEDDLLANVRRQGHNLHRALTQSLGEHPHVGDIRGRGLFQAVEFVADPESKEPFDPALGLNARVKREAMARGLPVVSTPVSGAEDALLDNEYGAAAGIVAGFDVESIARAVTELAASEGRRKELGLAARDRAERIFSVDSMLDRWEAFLVPSGDNRTL